MNNSILKTLLTEYDKKRRKAEQIADNNKNALYEQYPELAALEKKLSLLAINTAKMMLQQPDKSLIEKLNQDIQNLKMQKSKLLSSIGKTEEDLLPQYECSKCKDTGYTSGGSTTVMCNCLKQKIYDIEYNKSNLSNIKNQNFDNFNLDFYSDTIDESKYRSDISPKENIQLILNICRNFIDNFDNPDEKNLLFTGKTGLGKTFLSSCIANELVTKEKIVLYQTAPIMLDTIIDYKFGKANVSKNVYDYLLNVDLLVIDDLGTEGVNSMKLTELFNIINARLLNTTKVTKTIISTNLSLQNLFQTYDERIVSRIVGGYNICYFFGDDIRFKKK